MQRIMSGSQMKWLLFFIFVTVMVTLPGASTSRAGSTTLVAGTFRFPVDGSPSWQVGYGVPNPELSGWKECFQADWSQLLHAGEDLGMAAGTSVRAVANGKVVFAGSWSPGKAVIIKHTLPNNSIVYSMYGHLQPALSVDEGQDVEKGAEVGKITYQTWNGKDNSHLHWEIREFFDGSSICQNGVVPGPGYTYPEHPRDRGYKRPTTFIKTHSEGVTLFEHPNYEGWSLTLTDHDLDLCNNPLDPSQPPVVPCFSAPSWTDNASSLKVAPGWQARLHKHNIADADYWRDDASQGVPCEEDIPDFRILAFPDGTPLDNNVSRVYVWRCEPSRGAHLATSNATSVTDPCEPDLPPSADAAAFLSDITIPDGTVVSPGQALVKTWRVGNTGTTTWGSGYQLVFIGGEQMGAPSAVSIPSTAPGQEANLTVNLTAPADDGDHTGYWQLRNPQGTFFGDKLRVSIEVADTPADGHIVDFKADPPSPSSATTVRLYAKVNWWPQFRGMRVRLGDQVVGETGATEHTFDWDASTVSRGAHTLVLEVADQTDTSWSRPERRVMAYTLEGAPAPANHAPNRPSPSSPYDWYVYYSGNTAHLCAQAHGDPDGDAITGYYFDVYESAQLWNSGWVGSNCVTTGALGPYTYQWRVKVRDEQGAQSDWSDTWHFTLVNPSLSVSELYFAPLDGNHEQVRIRACTTGQGGIGITMRVSVNDANDGSGNGDWHIIKELGVPCFNEIDAPVWHTLEYGDGPHLVRAEAHGTSTGWDGAAVREEVHTLPHRRPASARLLAPVPPSQDIREAIYLDSRTVTFRWEPTIRASNYTLHVDTSPSPKDDPSPVFRQTFGSSGTGHTVNFTQDYPTLYWQVTTENDAGTNASGDQLFGIDRVAPSCTVQPLPATTYESVFQVSWNGSDNLSGIDKFGVQYLDSGRGEWNDWLTGIPVAKTYELFTGQPGHTYSFRCRATDNANNTGNYPGSPDASTTVDPTARPPTPWWDSAYSNKRNLTVLNNMPGTTLPSGYPVHLHFDSGTSPTAAELYNASQSSAKCNDLRIVYNDTTELDQVVENCSSTAIDIWSRTLVSIPGGSSNNTAHQLYYGNSSAAVPPGSPNTVFDPPDDGNTVSLWHMDEGGGSTLYDSSGSNNCTIDATTTWVTPAKFSGALRFLGGTDGPTVTCGSSSTFNRQALTVEMFLKRTGTAWGRLAGHLGNSQNRWLVTLHDSGKIRVEIWPCSACGAEGFTSNSAVGDTDNWHHVAFSLVNSTVKIYIDGQLDFTGQVVWGNIRSGTPPFTIGSAESIGRAFAEISHVRVSNIARTSFPYGAFAAITNEPTTAAGDPIDAPETGSPDLAVISLDTYQNPGGGILVQSVVRNQGDLETQNGFYVDLYANHLPSGEGDLTGSFQFWVNSPIAAGATVTLTTIVTDVAALGGTTYRVMSPGSEVTATLYTQVDSSGVINETDNVDNISSGVDVCVASPDAYESDDTSGAASSIALAETQSHNFDGPADQDWVKFDAQAGTTYDLHTSDLGSSADTYLYLYDTDGSTLLASNDDYSGTLASRIQWRAPADGTYYAAVQHWNPNQGGCGTSYDLGLTHISYVYYLPVILKRSPPSWNHQILQEVVATCGGSTSSTNYQLDGTCGQVLASDTISSTNYLLSSGYWATSDR